MPSVLGHLGLGGQTPKEPKSPRRDFSPLLRGEKTAWADMAFYETETTRASRTAPWKYVARFPSGPYELYDMQADPRERVSLFGQRGMEAAQAELAGQQHPKADRPAEDSESKCLQMIRDGGRV